jgi:hypothetical protein
MSNSLKAMRQDTESKPDAAYAVPRNGVLFSLDMNIAVIHMLGLRLHRAQEEGEVELNDGERVVIGMSATFMGDEVAALIDDALEGHAVDEARLEAILSAGTHPTDGSSAVH